MSDAFVGHYKIIRKIAETSVISRPEISQGLDLQVESLARLNHPNIARVFGSIRKGESVYLIVELTEGETLDAILSRKGRIQSTAALAFFQQALSAVGFAHSLGVVHGNLAPSNIVVTNFGLVKIMDFAMAHFHVTPAAAGLEHRAAQYVSPEQLRGEPVDARSDIYSLGILLYELIVGTVRMDSASEGQAAQTRSVALSLPRPLFAADSPEWLEAWLDTVLRRALADSPSNRFQSVKEMAHAMGFELEARDRRVWKDPSTVWLPPIGRQVSSASNRILATVNVALRSLRSTLDAASEVGRQQSASIGHAIRIIVAANQPTIATQRLVAGLHGTRSLVSSVFASLWIHTNRMFGSLKAILTEVARNSRQRSASIARATRLRVAAKHPSGWNQQVVVGLKRSGSWAGSVWASALTSGNRVFQSLSASLAGPAINQKRNAILASVVIAVAIGGFFFQGQNNPPLNEAVDHLMEQANSRPTAVKPVQRATEEPAKVVKPIDKRPVPLDKSVNTRRVSDKEREPPQKRVVVRAGRPADSVPSEKETTTAQTPPLREPALSPRNAENTVATNKLNVRWEN
jgi:serine/threonine protein kinase